jgi:hypothetical protein
MEASEREGRDADGREHEATEHPLRGFAVFREPSQSPAHEERTEPDESDPDDGDKSGACAESESHDDASQRCERDPSDDPERPGCRDPSRSLRRGLTRAGHDPSSLRSHDGYERNGPLHASERYAIFRERDRARSVKQLLQVRFAEIEIREHDRNLDHDRRRRAATARTASIQAITLLSKACLG